MLRGAISGFGAVAAEGHLVGWRTRPDVQIVAIHDPVGARRHAALNLIKNIRVYDDLELMLDGERLDFLDIASPPAYHAEAAQLALAAGVNVLVEKPLCLTRADLANLKQAANTSARVMMCVHNWIYAAAYQRAHQLISLGRLGPVIEVTLTRLRVGPAGAVGNVVDGSERWRLDSGRGGGILIDHGWHTSYLAQHLMSGASPLVVSARLEISQESRVEEIANLRVDFPAGQTAYIELSWRAPTRRTTAVIRGSRATLAVEGNHLVLTPRSGAVEEWSVTDGIDDSYHPAWFAGVASEFLSAIAEGSASVTAHDNLAAAAAALALIEAARESNDYGGEPMMLRSIL